MKAFSLFKRSALVTATAALLLTGTANAMAADDLETMATCSGGLHNGNAWMSCTPAKGEEWRLRADCPFMPDRYSEWINNFSYVEVGCGVVSARGAYAEIRN